tara:strand:- start:2411 stop:2911 length:501 start_codon:yes stop_codon:yes gene_type:complete
MSKKKNSLVDAFVAFIKSDPERAKEFDLSTQQQKEAAFKKFQDDTFAATQQLATPIQQQDAATLSGGLQSLEDQMSRSDADARIDFATRFAPIGERKIEHRVDQLGRMVNPRLDQIDALQRDRDAQSRYMFDELNANVAADRDLRRDAMNKQLIMSVLGTAATMFA